MILCGHTLPSNTSRQNPRSRPWDTLSIYQACYPGFVCLRESRSKGWAMAIRERVAAVCRRSKHKAKFFTVASGLAKQTGRRHCFSCGNRDPCSSIRRALTHSPWMKGPLLPLSPLSLSLSLSRSLSLSLAVFILWNRTAAARFKSVTVYNNSYW